MKFLLFIISTIGLSLLQRASFFSLLGVKPNLVLVFLIVSIFFLDDFVFYFLLTTIGYLLLKINPGLDWTALVFGFIILAAFWINKILPWEAFFNLLFLIFSGTTVFYLIVNRSFISNNYWLFFGELIYNLILAVLLYETFLKINVKET